jgi:hypothetical protein
MTSRTVLFACYCNLDLAACTAAHEQKKKKAKSFTPTENTCSPTASFICCYFGGLDVHLLQLKFIVTKLITL